MRRKSVASPGPLVLIAAPAQGLQIVGIVRSTLRPRQNVIHVQRPLLVRNAAEEVISDDVVVTLSLDDPVPAEAWFGERQHARFLSKCARAQLN